MLKTKPDLLDALGCERSGSLVVVPELTELPVFSKLENINFRSTVRNAAGQEDFKIPGIVTKPVVHWSLKLRDKGL